MNILKLLVANVMYNDRAKYVFPMNHKSTKSRVHSGTAQIRIFSTDNNSSQYFPEKLARLGSFCRVCTSWAESCSRGSRPRKFQFDITPRSHTRRTGVCMQPSTCTWFELESFWCTVSSHSRFDSYVAMPR